MEEMSKLGSPIGWSTRDMWADSLCFLYVAWNDDIKMYLGSLTKLHSNYKFWSVHPLWFHRRNNFWWTLKIMRLLINPLISCLLSLFCPWIRYSPRRFALKYPHFLSQNHIKFRDSIKWTSVICFDWLIDTFTFCLFYYFQLNKFKSDTF
jgi:hypothetical protein